MTERERYETRLPLRLACIALVLGFLLPAIPALAQGDGIKEPVIPKAERHPLKEIWSGYHYMSTDLRALQDSDEANPGMERYKAGEALWSKTEGKRKKSCSSCHGEAASSMRSAGARFPVYYALEKKLLTIEDRINHCREKFMGARSWAYDSPELLAMTIYVKRQAHGATVAPRTDGPVKESFDKGKAYYTARRGQLDMACSHCHGENAGRKLRGVTLSQGHSNGFPAYRKTWDETGSLLRQINQCLERVRAAPLKAGSDELADLTLYLAWRGQGLTVETPAVRE